jgi:hypothetical protein
MKENHCDPCLQIGGFVEKRVTKQTKSETIGLIAFGCIWFSNWLKDQS